MDLSYSVGFQYFVRRGVNRAWAACPIFERPKFGLMQAQFQ